MERRPLAALLAASIATLGLVACAPSKAAPSGPAVTSVSVPDARSMAQQFCKDLDSLGRSQAISKMAVRASSARLSSSDQDAIIDYAAKSECPHLL